MAHVEATQRDTNDSFYETRKDYNGQATTTTNFSQALEECGSDEAKFVRRIEAMTARLMTELFILTRFVK